MAIVNFEHLLDQAESLCVAPPAGSPRQVDLRRAISAAYYGMFHFVARAAADEFVGRVRRREVRYSLVYRGLDHRRLRDLCVDLAKTSPPRKLAPFLPPNGIGPGIQVFASGLVDMQDKRHDADYDPLVRFNTAEAHLAIATARSAIARFERASATRQKAFLTLALFKPR